MCFFISKNNKGLSIQKRDIDQSDLYKDCLLYTSPSPRD